MKLHAMACAVAASLTAFSTVDGEMRTAGTLNGEWQISVDEGQSWQSARVPETFEQQIHRDFDGVAWLRRLFRPPVIPAGQRLIIHFDAIATEAEIFIDDRPMGRHLGGWTPVRFDVTDAVAASDNQSCELLVKIDEKVGHNTQGFLPVIAPHFGGIWQDVNWMLLPEGAIDDLKCLVWGNLDDETFELDIPFAWGLPRDGDRLLLKYRKDDERAWISAASWQLSHSPEDASLPDHLVVQSGRVAARVPFSHAPETAMERPRSWSPTSPHRYQVQLSLMRKDHVYDQWSCWTAFRKIETRGRQLLLNGKPCMVRGLLNWGYQQDRNAPSMDPDVMREEIEFARARGFNLMKFCLWLPPKEYLELTDQLGILVWIEYPAWHPQFTAQHLDALLQEYEEFFHYDRVHASVILRSLTCETGPSADLHVIQTLYNRCHAIVPNALVEDDSSWIEWNRVHDFYDDHPYGNNHTWVATLNRLNKFIDERTAKPLILGEAIAADTWYEPSGLDSSARLPASPPIFADGNRKWLDQMKPRLAVGTLDSLATDSRHYAQLMRKYQIETFRREVPDGGYVVSVIRDVSLTGMGLIDYLDQPKSTPADWQWHDDGMLLLRTAEDRRSFGVEEPILGEIMLADGKNELHGGGTLTVRAISDQDHGLPELELKVPAASSGVRPIAKVHWQTPAITDPTRIYLEAHLQSADGRGHWTNRWPIWLIPATPTAPAVTHRHTSWNLDNPAGKQLSSANDSPSADKAVWLTRRLDESVLSHLEQGGNVLLVPDGGPGSPTSRSHWFLRGGPVINQAAVSRATPRELFVELQHFDLASDIVPELRDFDRILPLVALWDNHDLPHVKTHGLVFELPVGKGTLLVSALRHGGTTNAVGRWLLHQWIGRLSENRGLPSPARRSHIDPNASEVELGRSNLNWLRDQLHRREFALNKLEWRFQPDERHDGRSRGWDHADLDDRDWPTISIDRHWESQGYAALDGWAWYRVSLTLPKDWPKDVCYLSFTGVDDYYRCFVNGHLVGTGGDLEKRQTAFDQRRSHDISRYTRPGETLQIAVEVYDWYGAGGIFRPVLLTTTPISDHVPLLRPLKE